MDPIEEPSQRRHTRDLNKPFRCLQCHRMVFPLPSGGQHRNHCPFCLHSRHVDKQHPGDRQSECGALMAPVGHFQRPSEEYVLLHRCRSCGIERINRIAADDEFDSVLELPLIPVRTAREMKLRWLQDRYIPVVAEVAD
jgi:RNHCP domain